MANTRDGNDQAFLLKLSDTLRAETGVEAVGNRAVQLIAERLGADRVYLVTLNPDDDNVVVTHETRRQDMPPLRGSYRSSDFPAAIREIFERTIVYTDVRTDARLTDLDRLSFAGLGAVGFIAASIRRGSETMIWAAGALTTQPRSWTASEVALFEDAIERTWAAVERVRAEETLRQSEEKYRTLFESIDEGVSTVEVIFDENERAVDLLYLEHNSALTTQTGLTSDIIGKRISELFPDLEAFWFDVYERVARTGESERFEYPVASLNRWFDVYISRVGGEGSHIVVAVYNNMTERKRHEQQQAFLLRFSDTLRTLPNKETIEKISLQLLADWLELDRTYIATVYRLENRAVIGPEYQQPHLGLVPISGELHMTDFPEGFQQVEEQTLVVDNIATDVTLSERDRRSLGEINLTALVVASVRKGERDVIWSLVASTTTPRKWTNDEVQLIETVAERIWAAVERVRAEEALREANRRKDEFLAMLAHELRNPMATLHNTILLLTMTHGQDESLPLDKALAMMSREVTHLNRMVDDLLDVSRISQGKIQLKKERLDLRQLIEDALEATRSQFASRGQALTLHLPNEPIWVDGDRTRLTQVVRNLATNAAKYTPPGGQIVVNLDKGIGQAVLRIRDSGIGIAADQLQAIFEVFVQVSSSLDRPQGGLGLGLAVVRQLVELHDGQVGVSSPGLGQGSEFRVRLPLSADVPSPTAGTGEKRAIRSGRILVVDDNADLALTTAMLLRVKKYEAHTCSSGAEALKVVDSLQPDLVLLDLGMPDMDGYETCRRLRELDWGKQGVIVALSGYGQEEDKKRTSESGFDGHLVKPVNLQTLTAVLDKLLNTNKSGK